MVEKTRAREGAARQMLNKVPEITLWFWLVKVMCTTVGETAADYLNVSLNFGLTGTSVVTGALLAVALFFQFRAKRYVPAAYWASVMLVSVFGTLVTDNLTDRIGVPLEASTAAFGVLLAAAFLVWYAKEGTLSIHSVFTSRRETFYWLAILFTFALGTAAGDLMAEGLALGYATTGLIIAGLIALFAAGWRLGLNGVLSFWMVYVLTRPLGASIGDLLSQPSKYGGLGLGATATSFIFVGGILAIVAYLSVTKRDVIEKGPGEEAEAATQDAGGSGLWQAAAVVASLVIVGVSGYHIRHSELQAQAAAAQPAGTGASAARPQGSPLGDLSSFRTIAQDTLGLLEAADQAGATARVGDLEYEWDNSQARLKPKDPAAWAAVDGKIDAVLRELRAARPDAKGEISALQALLDAIK